MVYLGILVITGVTIYYYWRTMPEISAARRYLLAALRIIALAVIIILLFNPIIQYSRKEAIKPKQLLLLDNSISMDEKSSGNSKLEIFREAARKTSELFSTKGYDTEIISFANGINGDREASRLALSLSELQDQDKLRNVQDVFLFSDGWFDDNDPEFIQNIQFPVHVAQVDFEATGFDLQISRLKYNQRAWLREVNPVIVDVSADNFKGKAEVDFFVSEKKIQTQPVDFTTEKYQQLLFEHEFMDTGLQKIRFTVRTDSLQELETENNTYPGAILVLKDKAEVTIISDKMSWDGRYLVQTANQDQRFDVKYLHKGNVLRLERDIVELGSEMENCQVLCLINYGTLSFNKDQIELIDRYISNGGGLIFMGLPVKELEHLLPVSSSGIRREFEGKFRLAPESSTYQSFQIIDKFIDEIPPVKFYYTQRKLSGTLLAEFPVEQTPPAIIYHEFGNGKVLYLSFLDLWKWQLWGKDNHYQEFVSNILQWLSYAKSESFFAWSDYNSYLLGEEVNIQLTAFDEKYAPLMNLKAEILINKSGTEYIKDYLTRQNEKYNFSFIAKEPGDYNFTINDQARQQTTTGKFIITPANSEVRDRGTNPSLLNFLAEQTNGNIFRSARDFTDYPQAEISYNIHRYEIPLYKKWYTIAIFLICFCLEIFFRKRWGLL